MSHQRYPSIDPKEPHSVSLKVLRLSRPSLVAQHPLPSPLSSPDDATIIPPAPASLAYHSTTGETNPDPFLLTPILNLPPSFGSAYVGETFSCTLCANHDVPPSPLPPTTNAGGGGGGGGGGPDTTTTNPPLGQGGQQQQQQQHKKWTRDVRIEAEMKTPGGSGSVVKLALGPGPGNGEDDGGHEDDDGGGKGGGGMGGGGRRGGGGTDLDPGQTLQKIVNFDLKEEGNHVLAVTVSYYEATETSGRTRTFRKLYQFICKGSLIVRTKVGVLPQPSSSPSSSSSAPSTPFPGSSDNKEKKMMMIGGGGEEGKGKREKKANRGRGRRWVMEAQLENCSEDVMQLERVGLELEAGLRYRDCNWQTCGGGAPRPVLHPGEVEQCCFVVEEVVGDGEGEGEVVQKVQETDGRIVFGVLGIGWRSEMGNKGFLSTGKLGARVVR
ncbi:hypothetical protein F4778DRAFT_583441 [Xylariomycetidae sp. FL2044]|nr:hypothetical protein F4778DRAFT_583441 [Xylariomycetidae sp. FL2044]